MIGWDDMLAGLYRNHGDVEGEIRVWEQYIENNPHSRLGFEKMDIVAEYHEGVGNRLHVLKIRMKLAKLEPENAQRISELANARRRYLEHTEVLNLTAVKLGYMGTETLAGNRPIEKIPIEILERINGLSCLRRLTHVLCNL